jgi:serine/threonine-protein kinase
MCWLFHKGSYVGTATPKAHSYTVLDTVLTTDDTVVLKYGTPVTCAACPDMKFTVVQFQWQVDHVVMVGTPP